MTALLGYMGFEAAAVFSEEARVPGRTVPVAPALAAIAYGLWLRSARPAVYQSIGQGAQTSPP